MEITNISYISVVIKKVVLEVSLQCENNRLIEEKKGAEARNQELQHLLESTIRKQKIGTDALHKAEKKVQDLETLLQRKSKPDVLFVNDMGKLSEEQRR